MNYRPEIDGLRALAVIVVVLFHAELLPHGGFVGVDVFFVISGYLITSLILKDIQANKFCIIQFYERRARRILPALFVMSIFSAFFAWIWLSPSDLVDFADSLFAVPLYISNVYFWLELDYFDSAAELKPLLHTWSLAVEEQFYLVFPPMLLMIWRYQKAYLKHVFIAIIAASFAMSIWGANAFPTAAYFLPHTRIWELMIGALCALLLFRRNELSLPKWLDSVGLIIVLCSAFLYDEGTPFPSYYALAPTIGSALIILACTPGSSLHKLLSLKPIVSFGLISYSLYLWHQPIIAFARHRFTADLNIYVTCALILGSCIVAWLSWRWVEQPFRRSKTVSTYALWLFSGLGSVILATVGYSLQLDNGHNDRITANGQSFAQLQSRIRANLGLHKSCTRGFTEREVCRSTDSPNTLVWGDSYAMQLVPSLLVDTTSNGIVQQTKSACAPLIGMTQWPTTWSQSNVESCIAHNDATLKWLASQAQIDTVIIASNWAIIRQQLYDRDLNKHINIDGELALAGLIDLAQKIKKLGKTSIVISTTPYSGIDLGRCVFNAIRFDSPSDKCNFPLKKSRHAFIKNKLASIEDQVAIFNYDPWICPEQLCRASVGNTFIYRDKGHLSIEGAQWLGREANLLSRLREMAAQSAASL